MTREPLANPGGRASRGWALAVLALAAAGGCFDPVYREGLPCGSSRRCPGELVCSAGRRCVNPDELGPDAGGGETPDAGNAPRPDAREPDPGDFPDAAPGAIDAAPGSDDAAPGVEDGSPGFPDASGYDDAAPPPSSGAVLCDPGAQKCSPALP